jgi:hypothetical protein
MGRHAIAADPLNDTEVQRAVIPQPSFSIVRPDGHIGLCGTRADAGVLAGYAAGRLHLH